ncbi:hypothetical protein HZH66_006509 [Vespula vulgaris]|uniref:Uncharacterized protein n=1 Tax=Vespula vulgaris TaxID=7454 RepID=A0A834N717_VESVU|nr:hypothetical protein HZH66_006509 [Vespula vulgaris]
MSISFDNVEKREEKITLRPKNTCNSSSEGDEQLGNYDSFLTFHDYTYLFWPTWFFRPDLPLASTLPTSHVANSSNVSSSNVLSSRSHQDVQKGSENPYSNNRIHGQTPTICTAQPETGDSLFWPGRYPIYSFVTIVLPRFLEKVRETEVMSLIKLIKFCSKRENLDKVTQSISGNFGSKIGFGNVPIVPTYITETCYVLLMVSRMVERMHTVSSWTITQGIVRSEIAGQRSQEKDFVEEKKTRKEEEEEEEEGREARKGEEGRVRD